MVYSYNEFQLLNESLMMESFDFTSIKDKIMKYGNIDKLKKDVMDKLKYEIKNFTIRRNLLRILIAITIINMSAKSSIWSSGVSREKLNAIENAVTVYDESKYGSGVNEESIKEIILDHIPILKVSAYNHGHKYSISEEGKELIKKHEKLRLVGYSIGDGKITIGWGHAEPTATSKYSVGEKISKSKADYLFKKDIEVAEKGVRRIFKEWEDDNINVKITQSMFDAMVSMAYNMGVSGLRNTNFIQYVKRSNLTKAAEAIKTEKIAGFSGLKSRRFEEYRLFVSEMNPTSTKS